MSETDISTMKSQIPWEKWKTSFEINNEASEMPERRASKTEEMEAA